MPAVGSGMLRHCSAEGLLQAGNIIGSHYEVKYVVLDRHSGELLIVGDPDHLGGREPSGPLADFVHTSGAVQRNNDDIVWVRIVAIAVHRISSDIYHRRHTCQDISELNEFSIVLCVDQCSHRFGTPKNIRGRYAGTVFRRRI